MTTRAEEIAGEGPYTVVDTVYVKGPTGKHGRYWNERDAAARAKEFNAAYKQGQQDRWIPDGWALVPLVATPEMLLNAGFPASSTGDSTTGQNTWEWFVKSAPSPPNPEQR